MPHPDFGYASAKMSNTKHTKDGEKRVSENGFRPEQLFNVKRPL
jgi:hypothetical protein